MKMEAHALLPPPTQEETFDLITKTLIEKVGDSCVAEGTFSIRPGQPARLSWRIVSPTH
jgi:hypothetical protein